MPVVRAAPLLLALAACHSSSPAISVQLLSTTVPQLGSGEQQTFGAQVVGTTNQAVSWSVTEAGGGVIDSSGSYTAPVVAVVSTFHVVATSVAAPSKSVSGAVEVHPLGVRVWPASLTLPSAGSWQFNSSIYVVGLGDHWRSAGLAWSVSSGGGTVTSTGLYTAPTTAGTYEVTATSQLDPTQSETAAVTVLDASVADRDGPLWPLPAQPLGSGYTINGETVLDNTTGLLWQRAPASSDLRWDAAGNYCAALTLGGQGGWSLPTRIELLTIIDNSRRHPALDATAFPGVGADPFIKRTFWTSTGDASSGGVWVADFYRGDTLIYANFNPDDSSANDFGGTQSVRCVRPPASAAIARSSVTTGTVHDNWTNLTWQRQFEGGASALGWSAAKAACESLSAGGFSSGWRLPTELELASIVDDRQSAPAIDGTLFPSTPPQGFWSATPDLEAVGATGKAIYFVDGASYASSGATIGLARCVR